MMSESSSSSEGVEIECGGNQARLYRKKFRLGSRHADCIGYKGELYTPTKFQSIAGRRAAKNWKTSFFCNGKMIGDVMKKGELCHSNDNKGECDCDWCKHCREFGNILTVRQRRPAQSGWYVRQSPDSDPGDLWENSQDCSYKPGSAAKYVPSKGIGSRKRSRKRTKRSEPAIPKKQANSSLAEKTHAKDGSPDESSNDGVPEWNITSLTTPKPLSIGGDIKTNQQMDVHTLEVVHGSVDAEGIASDRDGSPDSESVIKVLVQETAAEHEPERTNHDAAGSNTYNGSTALTEDEETDPSVQKVPCHSVPLLEQDEKQTSSPSVDGNCLTELVVVNMRHAFDDFLEDCEELTLPQKCELLDRCYHEEGDEDNNRGMVIMYAILTDDNVFDIYKEAQEKELENSTAACRKFVKGRVDLLRSSAFKREVNSSVGELIECIIDGSTQPRGLSSEENRVMHSS